MHIWLFNPPVQRQGRSIGNIIENLFYNSPPLGIGFIAAVLEGEGHRVTITDCPVEGMQVADLERLARRLAPDLVGVTAVTPAFEQALAAAGVVRRALGPRVPICIGGPHMSGTPELMAQHEVFDFGVVGEGELTMQEVVRRLEAGKDYHDVPGVVTRQEGALHLAPPRPLLEDLDVLPFPARHLFSLYKYRAMPNDQYRQPKTSIITSRGCPFLCTFCDKRTFGARYRARSPGLVVDEMHYLEEAFGIRDLAFVDSTFTPNRQRITALLDEMERRPYSPRRSWCACAA